MATEIWVNIGSGWDQHPLASWNLVTRQQLGAWQVRHNKGPRPANCMNGSMQMHSSEWERLDTPVQTQWPSVASTKFSLGSTKDKLSTGYWRMRWVTQPGWSVPLKARVAARQQHHWATTRSSWGYGAMLKNWYSPFMPWLLVQWIYMTWFFFFSLQIYMESFALGREAIQQKEDEKKPAKPSLKPSVSALLSDISPSSKRLTLRHKMAQHLWPLLLTWFNFNPSMDK